MLRDLAAWLRFGGPRTLPAREAYALWAERYPPWAHNPLMRIEQAVVERIIASTSMSDVGSGLTPDVRSSLYVGSGFSRTYPRRALDVGTGSGRNLPLLAATGVRFVAGVDFSLPMLARHTHGRPRVCGDACRLPFRDASFELVSSSLMAGDMEDVGECIAEFARVLSPGGELIYSDFHPSWATGGWRRTFEAADGRSFELGYFPHAIAQHVAELERRSFEIRAIHEPRLAPPDVPAGSVQAETPALAIFHAVKRS
jgi:SAM-dependent methyltransferase